MLDFLSPNIQKLISDRRWKSIEDYDRIKQIYNFVRDEILFEYNVDDIIPASRVLSEGYGVAVQDLHDPVIDFNRNNTYIQREGINHDFGIYDCPDDLLQEHHREMSVFKTFLYRNSGRCLMNYNIKKIRNAKR